MEWRGASRLGAAILGMCAVGAGAVATASAGQSSTTALTAAPLHAEPSTAALVTMCPNANELITLDTVPEARRATLCLLNEERMRHGLSIVHTTAALRAAAKNYARNMVTHNFFDHRTPGGQDLVARLRRFGYVHSAEHYALGEALAWGTNEAGSPVDIVRDWLHSAEHRRIMLEPRFRQVGIGVSFGAPVDLEPGESGATYAVDFGTVW
jgi:uncharacterized protein YkwD